jgi:hypothetical protein
MFEMQGFQERFVSLGPRKREAALTGGLFAGTAPFT